MRRFNATTVGIPGNFPMAKVAQAQIWPAYGAEAKTFIVQLKSGAAVGEVVNATMIAQQTKVEDGVRLEESPRAAR